MAESKAKDTWDKWQIIINILAIILVPILVSYFGSKINSTIKDKEVSQKYVELAIGLLKVEPEKQPPALRVWAIKIVNAYSPVPVSEKVLEELKRKPLRPARVVQSTRAKEISSVASAKLPANGNANILTDEKGNAITDENGNVLVLDGEPLTVDGKTITITGKPARR